ncbi:Dyp-type peroxidase [Neorhizobium sp. BT27B]
MIDSSFVAGAQARAAVLGDELDAWLPAFQGTKIDGVMLVTGPDETKVNSHATSIVQLLGSAIAVVHEELGQTRPHRGFEHFGFQDGISQPGIRGLTPPMNPTDPEQGLPGQDLIHPGEFVFGYPGQVDRFDPSFPDATKETTGPIVEPPFVWMNDGAYMVFRRLEQRVLAFQKFVKDESRVLGMDEGLLAARLVGRWPSGAPLVLAPLQDDAALGADATKNNHFEFQHEDASQRRCPYAAHIRKTYPRDDLNDAPGIPALAGEGGEASVQTRRLRRAGIPFGREVNDSEVIGSEASRGLMFVCYQTSIIDQFEFVQKDWANNDTFVFGKGRPNGSGQVTPGHDPLIGQVAGDLRVVDELVPNYPTGNTRSSINITQRFVQATGAGYFFMPSIAALLHGPLSQ